MELIHQYVMAVSRHLPQSQRADVAKELQATIEDMAAGRTKQAHPSKADIIATLEELGDPELLAHQYATSPRHLIGPIWYDTYLLTLKRLLYVVPTVVGIVVFVDDAVHNPAQPMAALLHAVGSVSETVIHVMFWLTVTFIAIERSTRLKPKDINPPKTRAWTTAQLQSVTPARQISIMDAVMGVISMLSILVIVPLGPSITQIATSNGVVPIVNPALWATWMPALLVISGFTLVHELFKLKVGNWTPVLTITNIVLGLVSIGYTVALVTTQDIINPALLTPKLHSIVMWSAWITAASIALAWIVQIVKSIQLCRQLPAKQPKG